MIDFETTGLSPAHRARPTEIAVLRVREGDIVDRFQSLMNPWVLIPWGIQQFTDITDAKVRKAPPIRQVTTEAVAFSDGDPIVAQNGSFDRKFWEHATNALQRLGRDRFLCSLLLARRMFPDAPNYKLLTLVNVLDLPAAARDHRALADAECTARLFLRLQQEVCRRFELDGCDCGLLETVQAGIRAQLERRVQRYLEGEMAR